MPRRRLHGETQKRRKKPSTRLLKRKDSPVRVQATLQPAPFERSPRVERDDLEFLEAMRELEVRRSPWRGDSVARRQSVERVQFLAEDGEAALFQRSMAHLGVAPLGGRPTHPEAGRAPEAVARGASEGRPAATVAEAPAASAPGAPATATHVEDIHPAGGSQDPDAGSSGTRAMDDAQTPTITEFHADADAQRLMEALLHEGDFAPELKFAGAQAPPRRSAPRAAREDDEAEPDSELDLHGKTQEEAIRMVQNYLLVSQRQRMRHVLIITGRGHNSGAAGPVLKDAVYRWLELNGKRFVRAFTRAPARLGGEGAIWVTLR